MAILDVIHRLLVLVLLAGIILVYREESQNNRYRLDVRDAAFIMTDTRTGTIYLMPVSADAFQADKWVVKKPPTPSQVKMILATDRPQGKKPWHVGFKTKI